MAADVASLCTWPSPASKNPDLLQRFWTDVMGFDAPPEEFRAFKDAFSDPEFAGWAPADVVAAMTRAILLNPHFLLRK